MKGVVNVLKNSKTEKIIISIAAIVFSLLTTVEGYALILDSGFNFSQRIIYLFPFAFALIFVVRLAAITLKGKEK